MVVCLSFPPCQYCESDFFRHNICCGMKLYYLTIPCKEEIVKILIYLKMIWNERCGKLFTRGGNNHFKIVRDILHIAFADGEV